MTPSVLLLFDIDGTLVDSAGAGRRAIEESYEDVYGERLSLGDFDFRGRTDISIFREILTARRREYDPDCGTLARWRDAYLSALRRILGTGGSRPMPGAPQLLAHLAGEPRAALAVATGNLEAPGRAKLASVELEKYFRCGGFGESGESRADILIAATRSAERVTGARFAADSVYVIGDALPDIHGARAAGFRSVAVAAAWTSREELSQAAPDVLLDSLAEAEAFLAAVRLNGVMG